MRLCATAGREFHPALKINLVVEYSTKTHLVKRDKSAIIGLENMQSLIKHIHKALIKSAKTIATAESCTAGLVSGLLTQLSGSSQYFILGVTAYSDQTKKMILKVPASVITRNGAVSKVTASLMAKNIRKIAKTDFGIAITGIAGPTGATLNKPVGTIFIAVAGKNNTLCKRFLFRGNRNSIRKQAALKSLQLLKLFL